MSNLRTIIAALPNFVAATREIAEQQFAASKAIYENQLTDQPSARNHCLAARTACQTAWLAARVGRREDARKYAVAASQHAQLARPFLHVVLGRLCGVRKPLQESLDMDNVGAADDPQYKIFWDNFSAIRLTWKAGEEVDYARQAEDAAADCASLR